MGELEFIFSYDFSGSLKPGFYTAGEGSSKGYEPPTKNDLIEDLMGRDDEK